MRATSPRIEQLQGGGKKAEAATPLTSQKGVDVEEVSTHRMYSHLSDADLKEQIQTTDALVKQISSLGLPAADARERLQPCATIHGPGSLLANSSISEAALKRAVQAREKADLAVNDAQELLAKAKEKQLEAHTLEEEAKRRLKTTKLMLYHYFGESNCEQTDSPVGFLVEGETGCSQQRRSPRHYGQCPAGHGRKSVPVSSCREAATTYPGCSTPRWWQSTPVQPGNLAQELGIPEPDLKDVGYGKASSETACRAEPYKKRKRERERAQRRRRSLLHKSIDVLEWSRTQQQYPALKS